MKVGDYVRTIKGIGQVEKIEIQKQDTIIYLDSGITIDYITKDFNKKEIKDMYPSSPNIIDLIEVGDYVNGHYVREVELTPNEEVYKVIWTSTCDGMDGETLEIHKEEIESIVTKEQFESMEYKIGE